MSGSGKNRKKHLFVIREALRVPSRFGMNGGMMGSRASRIGPSESWTSAIGTAAD